MTTITEYDNGYTHTQALYGFHSLFEYLKRKGADDSMTNHSGKTCYELEATIITKK